MRKSVWCKFHQVKHVKLGIDVNFYKGNSWGCPQCVARIRSDVQKLRHPIDKWAWLGRLKGKRTCS